MSYVVGKLRPIGQLNVTGIWSKEHGRQLYRDEKGNTFFRGSMGDWVYTPDPEKITDRVKQMVSQLSGELTTFNNSMTAWRGKLNLIQHDGSSTEKDVQISKDLLTNSMASISSLEHQSGLLRDRIKSQLVVFTPEWKRMGYRGGK